MVVYHGTSLKAANSIMKQGIILSRSKEFTDFSKGFYVSEHYEYAAHTALNKEKLSKKYGQVFIPAVVELELDEEYLNSHLSILEFEEESVEWLQFIINNRNGISYVENVGSCFHNLGSAYDIVSGRVADGIVTQLAEMLLRKKCLVNMTDVSAVKYKDNPYATQISFHSPKAISFLKPIRIIKEVE